MLHICPETNGVEEKSSHIPLYFQTLSLHLLNERLHTVFLDLLFSVQTKLLLYFKFYRKTVGIPSCLTRYHVTLHCTVSGDHVLDNTGQYMTDMRLAVCSWRSVIECVSRSLLYDFPYFFRKYGSLSRILLLLFSRSTKLRFVSTFWYKVFSSFMF